jgi:hypothetical protein
MIKCSRFPLPINHSFLTIQLRISRSADEEQQIEVSLGLGRLDLKDGDQIVLQAINVFGEVKSKHRIRMVPKSPKGGLFVFLSNKSCLCPKNKF